MCNTYIRADNSSSDFIFYLPWSMKTSTIKEKLTYAILSLPNASMCGLHCTISMNQSW